MANDFLTLGDVAEMRPKVDGTRMLPPSERPLNLLLEWPKRTGQQWTAIVTVSLAVHFIFLGIAVQLPSLLGQRSEPEQRVIVHRIPLYLPPDVLTQKEPNKKKISKEIDLADLMETREAQARRSARRPSVRHFEIPKQAPVKQAAKPTPQILPDIPKVAESQPPKPPQRGSPAGLTPPAPPPPAPSNGPFQSIGTDAPPNPYPTLRPGMLAMRAPAPVHDGDSDQLSISDDSASSPRPSEMGAAGQGSAQHSAVELKSDAEGADFKPYLRKILAIVRTNWRRVIPQSARDGTLRGRTVVEFIVDRDGNLPKIVIAQFSGSEALDRAAAAGLTMSNPLPPLPDDFKGNQVRLAFTFAYNVPPQ